MGTHLYVCDERRPMIIDVEGTPPKWATCPVCTEALDCAKCDGAQLQGDAPPFTGGFAMDYRCAKGHVRTLRLPAGEAIPESAHCPDCDGMLLPVAAGS